MATQNRAVLLLFSCLFLAVASIPVPAISADLGPNILKKYIVLRNRKPPDEYAKGAAAWATWDAAITGVTGMTLTGIFDPDLGTRQAPGLNAVMDTRTYVRMLGTPGGQEKLKFLNMPSETGPTTFSSDFRTDQSGNPYSLWRMVPGTSYEGDFGRRDASGSLTGSYYYEYFVSENSVLQYGEKWYNDYPSWPYSTQTGVVDLPTGEHLEFLSGWSPWRPFSKTDAGDWTVGGLDPSYFSDPPTTETWERTWYGERPSNVVTSGGEFTGILRSADDLWRATSGRPAKFVALGTYVPADGDYSKPSLFWVDLVSSEITQGHYQGFIGGLIDHDVTGFGYALYESPVMRGSGYPIGILKLDFAGSAHPGAGTWDAAGTVYSTKMGTALAYPDDFSQSVEDGFIVGWMNRGDESAGPVIGHQLKSPGTTMSLQDHNESAGPVIGSQLAWGTTMSLQGHDDWGIFNLLFGYDNYDDGPAPWTAVLSGWGEFGYHDTKGSGRIADIGRWITEPMTITADNPLQAGFTGEVLTYSKWAQISGDFLGSRDPGTNSFLAGAGGYWYNERPLDFNGIIDGNLWHKFVSYHGGWDDGCGNSFSYNYLEGSNSGWSTTLAGGVKTQINYNPDGTYEAWTDDNGTLSSSKGTWDTAQSLLDILTAQTDASAPSGIEPYYDGPSYDTYNVGDFQALAGGFSNLWDATPHAPARTRIIGDFNTWYGGMSAPPVFSSVIRSYNPYDDTARNTIWNQSDNSRNGNYWGYMVGRGPDQNAAEGDVLALGMDKDGNAYFITGPVNLTADPDSGTLQGWASVFPLEIVQGTGYDSAHFNPSNLINTSVEHWQGNRHGQFMDENGNPIGGDGDINLTDGLTNLASTSGEIDGVHWVMAVRNGIYAGKYNDVPGAGTSNYWEIPYATDNGVKAKQGFFFSSNESDMTRGEWQSGKISGKTYGAWVGWNGAVTGITGGDLKGTFDPNTYTWQMAASAASIDTKTFTNLLATPEGRDKLKLLNMPYVQIGQTTLTQGAGTVNGMQNVKMNNVKFLAYSTGGAPRAFVSPDVSGQYSGTVTAGGNAVSLTGKEGISASFQVNRWDGKGGNWGANITGGGTYTGKGTMKGSTVQMNGFGAGKIGTSTFSGTAAGTAKLAPPN